MTMPSPPPQIVPSMLRIRPEIDALAGYVPGRRPVEDGRTTYKLSSNEAIAAPAAARDAAAATAGALHLYPDMVAADLRVAIAEHHDATLEMVALGVGSVEVISQAVRAVSGPGSRVLYPWRSFEAYPLIIVGAGADPIAIPLDESGSNDLDALLAAIDESTTCVMVCNPNNPTGTAVDPDALAAFIDAVPEHVLIVVDEAYIQFDDREVLDVVEIAATRPNVLAVRTFSKAYGLAGLRVGYAIGHPNIIGAMNKLALPFAVSAAAQAGAIAVLEDDRGMQDNVTRAQINRARVQQESALLGIASPRSATNFVWFPCATADVPVVVSAFEAQGVIVRPFPDGVRVTIADERSTQAVLAALPDVAARIGRH